MLPLIQSLIAVVFYILVSLTIFWEPLINKFGSIQWDGVSVHFFNLFFSSEIWSKGIFPLWSPYIFAGFPQIADLQVAFFYPINLIISLVSIITPEIIMYQLVLHYFLAGFFAFLLTKYLSKNFWFSAGAGLVYSFGGFMAGHASHIGMQNTATWLPLIFLLLILALKKTKILYAALCGLFMGIAILAGHFQASLYIACAVTFYFIFDTIWIIIESIKNINKKITDLILIKIKIISIIFTIAFLISAIQLLPTFELTQHSNRAKITLEMSQTESLNPKSLKSLIEPNYNNVAYGTPYFGPWDRTQNYLYLGYAIILIAIFGTITGVYYQNTRKITFFWLILLVISLFYSLGEFSFLQKYFYRFAPFFDKIRAPSNMMILFNLSVIGLASVLYKNIGLISKKIINSYNIENYQTQRNILRLSKKIILKNITLLSGITAFLIISIEIITAVQPNTLLYSRQKTGEITIAPPIATKIADEYKQLDEIDKFRIFKVSGLDNNLTQLLHLYAFDGYNPLSLRRHNAYIDAMVKNEKLINLAAIKYLPCEFILDRANALDKIGHICVNKSYSQLAFFVDNYQVVNSETEALQKIQEVDLNKTIILEETPPIISKLGKNIKNNLKEQTRKISLVDFQPGFWRFTAETNADTFLFINQANYPGWIAKINGVSVKIYQTDYLFQSIFIPKGKHEITLKFESKPLIIGRILAIIGISSVILIILGSIPYNKKNIKKKLKI